MKIDINCDLGEGMDNDALLMPHLDSCNIACGGHFGDAETMLCAINLAKKHGVKIGAHPSFPDTKNFGRQLMDISQADLQASLYQQLNTFKTLCDEQNVELHHIKLHGALYNLAATNFEMAAMILNVFASIQAEVLVYVPYQSVIAMLAEDYFPIFHEAFIDRRYHSDLRLVSRTEKGAVITDIKQAWQQMSQMITDNTVTSIEGKIVPIKADTFCLHGDQDNALELIKYIRQCL